MEELVNTNDHTGRLMKAVRLHEFGGPEVLRYEDAPMPKLKTGEVLVKVFASALNPPDWYLRDGYHSLPPEWQPKGDFPMILGTDISGVVAAVANDVKDFKIGDEVYAMVRFFSIGESKGYAQYVSVPVSDLAIKPASIDHVHTAGAPMSLLTAWQFLVEVGHNHPNPLQPHPHVPVPLKGKTVLVNGAAGGVGHFAVQVAKLHGAKVIAVAAGQHETIVRNLGADEFIDYTQTPADEVVRDIDLVVDTIGGASSGRFLKTLKRGGALFPVYPLGFADYDEAEKLGITVSSVQVRSSGVQLAKLAELLNDGSISVLIDSTFPLSAAREAHERAAKGHIQGKIVLTVA
ncbi:NADP-dependent oxidoreductase [Mucilaginibacter gossypii]|uniref:NADPH:quinone reductase n=1 Tax=Mucilaginibacter gossypii TaxID=551996 RepID=A0A1G8AGT6_9SPHI|nr:NADP-dependent oxidoreductase [Mucilaginibacter gossypii]SDH20194.1 NADPH:quinone reductase [Mucilaginibacter gossypii]